MTDTPKSHAVLECRLVGATGGIAAAPVYSQSFAAGTDSWVGFTTSAVTATSGWLRVTGSSLNTFGVTRAIAGLTVGEFYTVRATVRNRSSDSASNHWPLKVSASGSPGFALSPVLVTAAFGAGPSSSVEFTFLAEASSQTVTFEALVGNSAAGTLAFEIDSIEVESSAYVLLEVTEGEITLDDTRAPYAHARVVVPMQAEVVLEQLDPRDGIRLGLLASLVWDEPAGRDPQARTFDLLLHERTVEQASRTATLVAHSDEALLIDAAIVDDEANDDAEAEMSSLRDIVDVVLARHGAELEATPNPDADFTITFDVINKITNPSGEVNAADWAAGTGMSAVARSSTVGGFWGSWSIRGTCSAASSNMICGSATGWDVTEGTTYTWSVWVQSQVARNGTINIQWRNSTPAIISTSTSAAFVTSVGGWSRYDVTAAAPAGAVKGTLYLNTTGNAVGQFHYMCGSMFTEGELLPYFDGDWPTDAYYSYAWLGPVHASASQRTRLDNRDQYLLKQMPGVTDWAFLAPLVQASGLRLFCDEQRRWRLVDPDSYTVAGTVAAAIAENITAASDTISLEATRGDGSPVWCSGVVVRYSWVDAATLENRIEYDYAGSSQKVAMVELDAPYPGPGEAARRLAAAQGRGRVQQITALADLDATPGMQLETTLDDTPDQVGMLSAVTLYWAAEGEQHDLMTLTARDLEDA